MKYLIHRKKLSQKDIKNLEQVLKYLKQQRNYADHSMNAVRVRNLDEQISAIKQVLYE